MMKQLDAKIGLSIAIGRHEFSAVRKCRPQPQSDRTGIKQDWRVAPVDLPDLKLQLHPSSIEAGHMLVRQCDRVGISQEVKIRYEFPVPSGDGISIPGKKRKILG